MWYQIELPEPTVISELQFDSSAIMRPTSTQPAAAGRASSTPAPDVVGQPVTIVGYPRRYAVQTSTDGRAWSAPIIEGAGRGLTTVVTFLPVTTRFLRITQTASPDAAPPWSIQNLQLFGPPETTPSN